MKIIKGIKIINSLDLSRKEKNKAIFYGFVECIINSPKNLVWLICAIIGIPFVLLSGLLHWLAEICEVVQTPFENICINIKNSADITVAPQEFKDKFNKAVKEKIELKAQVK